MSWYTNQAIVMMDQHQIEQEAKEGWKYASFRPKEQERNNGEDDERLYGKAIHVLQEMLDSDNAELRLRAAEIVMRNSLKVKRKGKMTYSS